MKKFVFFVLLIVSSSLCQQYCCNLVDVYEDGAKTGVEIWDIFFYGDTLTIDVVAFTETYDNDGLYTFVWHQKAKTIRAIGVGKFTATLDGRMSPHDMNLLIAFDSGRIVDLKATIPIGEKGKEIKQFRINRTIKSINVILYNSCFKEKE